METAYVGQLGKLELAAVSFTFPIAMILQGAQRWRRISCCPEYWPRGQNSSAINKSIQTLVSFKKFFHKIIDYLTGRQ